GTASATATITAADVDGTVSYDAIALVTAGWTNNGDGTFSQTKAYGTATLHTTTNTVTFALDNSAADSLTPSDHPTQAFTVAVKDDLGALASTTVTFTVDGIYDAPTVSAVVYPLPLHDALPILGTASATATITAADVDGTV